MTYTRLAGRLKKRKEKFSQYRLLIYRADWTCAYLTTNENDETLDLAEGTNWDWALLSIRDSRPRYRLRTCWTRRRWLRCPRGSLAVIRSLFARDETEMHEFRLVNCVNEGILNAHFCNVLHAYKKTSFPIVSTRFFPKMDFNRK